MLAMRAGFAGVLETVSVFRGQVIQFAVYAIYLSISNLLSRRKATSTEAGLLARTDHGSRSTSAVG